MTHFDHPGAGQTAADIAKHKAKLQRQAKRVAAADAAAKDFQWRRELTLEQEREARELGQPAPEIGEYERYQKPHRHWRPPCPHCISEGVEPAPHEGKGLCRRHYQRKWAKENRPSRAKGQTSTQVEAHPQRKQTPLRLDP